MRAEDQEYHTARARQELDLGYRANGRLAAAAHMRLAALHMKSAQSGVDDSDPEVGFGGQRAVHAPINNSR
jgi:hypothetical protein